MEPLTRKRLARAFSKKCEKLQRCKEEGARTVLVLESTDAALAHFEFRGTLLREVLAQHSHAPDAIFLVESRLDFRKEVVPLKYGDSHWPDTGMPELGGFYYDPNNCDIPKWLNSLPRRIREVLQDQMYTPFEQGFSIESFGKDELNDLTQA